MKYEMHRVTSFLIERFSKNIYLNIMKELNSNNDDIINLVKYNIKDIILNESITKEKQIIYYYIV